LKKGAEADISLVIWRGMPAISKVRQPKQYRHSDLDLAIRTQRTVHEATLLSAAKAAGVRTPFVCFVDPEGAEIIMEHVEGPNVKDVLDIKLCKEMGRYTARLHGAGIVHGDLTTSNFIVTENSDADRLILLDFGLSYYSDRIEDLAVDIRLIKEIFTSAHISVKGAFSNFVRGYKDVAGKRRTTKILENVREIERRGRYARLN